MPIQTYGTQKRANPRLAVLRGWDINNPSNIAPRAVPAATQGTILSGHLISKDANGKWVLGCTGSREATMAFSIQDDVDFDVIGSGVLTGISVLGKYEVQTPYFTTGGGNNYTPGAPLTYDGTSGRVKVAAVGTGGATDQPIIGFVSGGVIDVSAENSSVETTAGVANVLQFVTNYQINAVDATGA